MDAIELIDKAFLLKKNPLFQALDLDALLNIAEKMEFEKYSVAAQIVVQGTEASCLYIIFSGKVLIKDAQGQVIRELTAGDLFGDEPLLSGQGYKYGVEAGSACQLMALSHSHFMMILSECFAVTLALLESYATALDYRGLKSE